MAFNHKLVILAIIVVFLPRNVLAKEFIVGDEKGWTIGFDYQAWAKSKKFRVGDTLVFKYPVGSHNVFKANETAFQSCIVSPKNEALTSGNDRIDLATLGKKWYICGVGKHCETGGQKLVLNVQSKSRKPISCPVKSSSLRIHLQYYSTYGLLLLMTIVVIVSMDIV